MSLNLDPSLGLPVVYLVDDEDVVRDALAWLLRSRRLLSEGFALPLGVHSPPPSPPGRGDADLGESGKGSGAQRASEAAAKNSANGGSHGSRAHSPPISRVSRVCRRS